MGKKVQDGIAVVAFSIAALLAFRLIPDFLPETQLAELFQYLVVGFSFLYFMAAYRLPTLRFLKRPQFGVVSLFAFTVGISYILWRARTHYPVHLSWLLDIEGVIYLLALGFGEEIVSRGFVYGILEKYGKWPAILLSSLAFGLMHINVYIGKDWDPYQALIHVISATGFGILACAVMLASNSIWPAVIMHGLSDWTVYFEKEVTSDAVSKSSEIEPWTLAEILTGAIFQLSRTIPLALVIFFAIWLNRRAGNSTRLERILLRLKLIETE